VLNRWDAFVRYTSDGRIRIDNNIIERLLQPVAISRNSRYLHLPLRLSLLRLVTDWASTVFANGFVPMKTGE
jgi:hypothetical protein